MQSHPELPILSILLNQQPMKHMKTLRSLSAGALFLLSPAPQSLNAAVSFWADMDPSTAAIESTWSANPGETLSIGILMETDASGISSYGISAQFDTSELALHPSLLPVASTPTGMADVSLIDVNTPGTVLTFGSVVLGSGPTSTTVRVGTIHFRVLNALDDGIPDIRLGLYNLGVDGAYDNTGSALIPTFHGGYVVPEPSGIGLGIGALLGLIFLRNRRG